MFENFDIEEVLDVLVESYGFSPSEAVFLINQVYEEELNLMAEAAEILVEEYGYDEDEATDLVLNEGFVRRALAGTRIPTGVELGKSAYYSKKAEKLKRKADKYKQKEEDAREMAKGHAEVFNAIEDEKTKKKPYRDRRQIYVK